MANNNKEEKFILLKVLIALISIGEFWVFHQIDITSRHFAVAFNIPLQNISIFFDKLFSIRCLLIVVGYFIEYGIYQIGGGDRNNRNDGEIYRKYSSLFFFVLLFFTRVIFLVVLYVSKQPAYHVYMALSLEALVFGANDSAYMANAAQFMSIISMFFNISRLVVNLVQIILDTFMFKDPMLMIKIITWSLVILSALSVCLWYYYVIVVERLFDHSNESLVKVSDGLGGSEGSESDKEKKQDTDIPPQVTDRTPQNTIRTSQVSKQVDTLDAIISPFTMFSVASYVKDFLYPGTLPYAVLHMDKCHTINKVMPFFNLIGHSVMFVIDNIVQWFEKWTTYYNGFFILGIPMPIIITYSFMAVHSHVQSAIAIRNSKARVMTMTLVMIFCYGFLDALGYIGVAKYASRGNPYGYTIQAAFNLYALFCRSVISRLSVGYNVTRVELGYHLPKFRPVHRMSKSNLNWYIFRHTFKRAWTDLLTDLTMDLKKFL